MTRRGRILFSPPPSIPIEVEDGVCDEDAEERSFKAVEDSYGLDVAEVLQWNIRWETEAEVEQKKEESLKACVAFAVDYLSDQNHEVAERDSWIEMCEALDRAGINVFGLSEKGKR